MVKTIAIVSLSSGMLGEEDTRPQLELGLERLHAMGLRVKFMPHALCGSAYVMAHPEDRAADLLEAFRDPSVDMILCAIGGDDTYRLAPYLFGNGQLQSAVSDKIFLGFSDTTINHFMLRRAGLRTFYGQSFIADVCELGKDMLPYSRRYFEELIRTGTIREIRPSGLWYESREENGGFGPDRIGTSTPSHPDGGYELVQGEPVFGGEILGGCIDSIYDMFDGERYPDMPVLCEKYGLFPGREEWKGKILLVESSEEKPSPEKYEKALVYLKNAGVFDGLRGVLVGRPMDKSFDAQYRQALIRVIADPELPVVCNVDIGHGCPRCIMPLGRNVVVDANEQVIRFL